MSTRNLTLHMGGALILCIAASAAGFAQEHLSWPVANGPDNAALVYYRALLLFSDSRVGAEDDAFVAFLDDGAYDAKYLDSLVDRNADALSLMHVAASIPSCDFGVQFDQGYSASLPEMARTRALARVAAVALRKALNDRQGEQAVGLACDVLQLARHIHSQGNVIYGLIAAAIVGPVYDQMPILLEELPNDDALYGRLAEAVDAAARDNDDWTGTIEGEKKAIASYMPLPDAPPSSARLRDALDALMANRPEADTEKARVFMQLAADTVSENDVTALAELLGCSVDEVNTSEGRRAQLVRQGVETMRLLNRFQEIVALPYPDAAPQAEVLLKGIPEALGVAQAVLPSLGKIPEARVKDQTRLRLMQCAIAVTRWQIAYGRLPESLDDLGALPADPFTAGRPFTYRLLDQDGFSLAGTARERDNSTEPISLTVRRPG